MSKERKCSLVQRQAVVKFNLACPTCGKDREYATKESLERAASLKSTCTSCRTARNNTKRKGTKAKEKNPAWRGYKDIPGKVFSKLQRDARTRNIEFNILIEDLWEKYEKQQQRCALSGVYIKWGEDASVDRIDSNKDYTKDNIQIVHKTINMMKRDLDQDEFIRKCCNVSSAYYNSFLNHSRPD